MNIIVEEIKNHPHPHFETVVTSDKRLARQIRLRSAHTESVEDFILWLNSSYKNKLRRNKQVTKKLNGLNPTAVIPKKVLPDPSKDASPEYLSDYYLNVFESEWKEIVREEKVKQETLDVVDREKKKKVRTSKKKRDPFEEAPTKEEKAATEMERWQKIFEKRDKT